MTSPNRSVIVRLAMEPTSYIAGASRAAAATTALDREVAKVGATSATSMERAAAGAGKTEGAFGRLNKATSVLGVNFGTLAAAGGAVAVALSIKSAGDFQQSLTKLATTAGESTKNLHMVGDGMLDMAGQVGISANELAKGMYTVESSGIHGANALTVLKAAAQGAKQENADLGKVTDAVTTALHDYNLPASDAAKVTSQLVTAVSHGKTTFDELTGAMHSVTPLAAALHVPLADIAGTLSAMTASGESADQAAQNMADALRHMQNPTATMTAELAQLGITSTDLGPMLGERGLAGTIQTISGAILKQMGPAGTVMLDALNKSKVAADDLQIMLKQMPPSLAKLSEGFLNGSVGISDYRKGVNELGGQAGAMGTQFLSLVKTSQGFNGMLKSGQPDVQTYTAALQKAMGTSAGLTVALQVTGEHAAATNVAIKDIAGSTAQADKNIKGWSEVQGNFNQQLSQAEHSIGAMAIRVGQTLLPVLTSAFGYVNRDVVPGLERMGSAAGDAAHWWSQLPTPIKDVSLALGGLALSNAIGLTGLLSAGATKLGTGFAAAGAGVGSFNARVFEQQSLMASQARIMAVDAAATGTFAERMAALALAEDAAAAAGGRLSATMVVAGRSIATGAMSAGSKFVNMLGGPWMLATAGAVLGVLAVKNAVDQHDAAVKKATQDVAAWNKTMDLGGSGQSAIQAEKHLQNLRDQINDLQGHLRNGPGLAALHVGGASADISSTRDRIADLNTELTKGEAAWKKQLAAMTPVEEATARVDIAEHDLQMAMKGNPPNSQAVSNATIRLQEARQSLNGETERANNAEKTQIQRMQESANAALGLLDAQRAAQMSQLQLADAIDQYNADATDGQHTTRQLQEEQLGLVDSARQAAQTAADAAAAQAKQNGATDTGAASQAAFLKSLQDTANHLTGPGRQAVLDMITVMGSQKTQAELTAGAINQLGITVTDLPSQHFIDIQAPTDQQMKNLHDLGYATVTLPNGKIVVSADTNPAMGEIQDLLNYARQQSITYRATLPDLNGSVSGSGRPGLATGGWVRGPGTGTSDDVPIMGSNGEFMVKAAAAAQNAGLLEDINAGRVRGYATGGWVGVPPGGAFMGAASMPVSVQDAGYKAAVHALAQQLGASAPGAPTSVQGNAAIVQSMAAARGWTGAEWNALYALVMRESGFRNTAQNPTSTAYGMFQFLNSTWGAYGGGKTSDPTAQTRMGLDYIAGRYRDPIGAWGHETKYGWYKNGTDSVPFDMPAMLHKGEAVIPATENARVRSREVSGRGSSGRTATATAAPAHFTVIAQFGDETMEATAVRVVTDYADAGYQRGRYNGG